MNTPLVSVIIPAYNAGKTIEQTLESVFSQNYEPIEVIVINDGSTDNTAEILNNYVDQIIVHSTKNMGVSFARNLGFSFSTGDFIQFLDADDLLADEKIKFQVTALISETADVAYGNWQSFTETDGKINLLEVHEEALDKQQDIHLFSSFWCPPANLLYRRTIVEKIGKWKEWLPIIQDARFMLDASIAGGKFLHVPKLSAYYRTGQSHSLSTKNALAFVKDVFTNAKDVWRIWKSNDLKDEAHQQAVINCLRYCINEFSKLDRTHFEESIETLLEIKPNYLPEKFGLLRILSIVLGYRKAEKIAAYKRKIWR